jgi:putative flippase GtrA
VRSLAHEVAKFGVVGATNFVLDVALFNLLRLTVLAHRPITAAVLSTSAAATSSYFMNRHWTWRHRARTGVQRELPLFLALSGVGLAIAVGCLAVSHYVLGFSSLLADNVAKNGVGLGLGMAWRFWSFKRWVFRSTGDGDEPTPLQDAVATTV